MHGTASLGDGLPAESEALLRRFELAWQGPRPPNLDDFLAAEGPIPTSLLVELIRIDLDFQLRKGAPARVERYLQHYPSLARDGSALLEVIVAEYSLRCHWQAEAKPGEFFRRFPEHRRELQARLGGGRESSSGPRERPSAPATVPSGWPDLPGYEISRELGRGGMGIVYQARQSALGRVVALKTILPGHAASAEEMDRFRRESESIALLDHPHIVPVYEVGKHGDLPYFSMKFYPGGSLAQRPGGPGTDPHAHALLVETVARAVHHAHRRGILHRDLKPANILLDESGQPHVVDFGLAKRFDLDAGASPSLGVVGTPSYSAPEQAQGHRVITAAGDVYGLGAILYERLAGRPPFRAETAIATLIEVTSRPPRRPSCFNPLVPADLETICLKCLEKEPSRRYPSALKLAEDLERWRNGEPILARPATVVERSLRRARRHPAVTALFLVTGLALGLAVVTLAVSSARIEAQAAETARALARGREALGRGERLSYLERVATASRLWSGNHPEAAARLLDACPPQFRDHWEWKFLDSLRRTHLDRFDHGGAVFVAAYSPDGRSLATAGEAGVVKLRDVASGRALDFPVVHGEAVTGMAFSPDGSRLVTANRGDVRLWDVATGREVFRLPGSFWAAFSPDGRYLASALGKSVKVWEVSTGRERHSLTASANLVRHGAFSPDSRQLAIVGMHDLGGDGPGDKGVVQLWEVESGREVGEPRRYLLPLHSLAFSPDGTHLMVGQASAVLRTDAGTGRESGRIEASMLSRVRLAMSPDGRYLVYSIADRTVRVWDLHAWREAFAFRGHAGDLMALAFSPDGRRLASGGKDGTVKVWDLTREPEVRVLAPAGGLHGGLAVGADGRRLAVASSRSDFPADEVDAVLVLDTATRREALRLRGCNDVAFSPDGHWLATGTPEGVVTLWDSATGGQLRTLCRGERDCHRLAISPDGKRLFIGGIDGSVQVWDTCRWAHDRSWCGDGGRVQAMALSPDAALLATAGENGVRLRDVATGALVLHLERRSYSYAVAFSPDGRRIAAGIDGVIHLWEVESGRPVGAFHGHTSTVLDVAFSPDGLRLVSGSLDGSARLWDVESGRELLSLPGVTAAVRRVAFSPDGRRIIAVDSHIKFWEAGPARRDLVRSSGRPGRLEVTSSGVRPDR